MDRVWQAIVHSVTESNMTESYASQTTNQVRRSSKDIFRHIRSFKVFFLRKLQEDVVAKQQESRSRDSSPGRRPENTRMASETANWAIRNNNAPTWRSYLEGSREMTARERNYYFMCLSGMNRVLQLQWNIWEWIIDRHRKWSKWKSKSVNNAKKRSCKRNEILNTVTQLSDIDKVMMNKNNEIAKLR